MNGPYMLSRGPVKFTTPNGRVAIADRNLKYYPLRVGHLPDEHFRETVIEDGKVVRQTKVPDLTKMLHEFTYFAAEPEDNEEWSVDIDCGCQRWRGYKTTAEIRRALKKCEFRNWEILLLLHEARGGESDRDDYWETERPFDFEIDRHNFSLPDGFNPEEEFELVFGCVGDKLEDDPGEESWYAVRTVGPRRYHILRATDMWDAGYEEDERPRYVISLSEVNVDEILESDPTAIGKLDISDRVEDYVDTPDEKYLAVDFAMYGQEAPLWSMSGNDWAELVHEAKNLSARLCSEYSEWYQKMYEEPVNRMGSSAHDYMLG